LAIVAGVAIDHNTIVMRSGRFFEVGAADAYLAGWGFGLVVVDVITSGSLGGDDELLKRIGGPGDIAEGIARGLIEGSAFQFQARHSSTRSRSAVT
jgi:hypothetical protein